MCYNAEKGMRRLARAVINADENLCKIAARHLRNLTKHADLRCNCKMTQ